MIRQLISKALEGSFNHDVQIRLIILSSKRFAAYVKQKNEILWMNSLVELNFIKEKYLTKELWLNRR